MEINLQELSDFLQEANKKTYANQMVSKVESLRLGSDDYHFEKGNWTFHDTYFGARDFIGEEVIYKDHKPVWAMNYFGRIIDSTVPTDEAYQILRPALMRCDESVLPVRGPEEYLKGNHRYQNKPEGNLEAFSGIEEIYIDEKLVYRGIYHGGLIH